ncbi:MAG: metallophosphoesterase, partial [Clostridia bacterium]|nr:metallophosphoesterase [Clostridia bacterium]
MEQKTLFSRVAKALCLAFMFTVVGISALTGAFGTAFASNAPLVDKSQVEVPSEDEYAYSIMIMGDPQYMTICDYQNGTNYTDRYYSWIAENASKLKTKFLVGVGDIVHNDTEREFRDVVKPALAKFDTVGLPYALVRGNHDNRAYWYDKYIGGESQYMKQDTIVSYYANPDDDERLYSTKARNTAHEYIVGETKYLVICLDFGAQDPVLEWANSVVGDSKYANHNVFVTTHGYMSGSGEYLDGIGGDSPSRYDESFDNPEKTVPNPFKNKPELGERVTYKYNAKVNPDESFNDGDDIWDKFVRKHANIRAVFCGHVYANEIVNTQNVGDHGNVVQEFVINPQVWDDDGKDDGAAGYADSLTGTIAILYCSEDGQAITVRNYSVLKDKYLGEESQFDVRLNSREWTEGEGKTFVRDKLYSLEKPLTSFPKTVEVNMKYSAPTSNKMVVSSFSGGGVNFAVRVMKANASKGIDAGDLGIFYSGEGASLTFKSVNYDDDDKYHHYAFTFDDSNAYCYVDGELKETVAHSWGKIDDIDMSSKLPLAIGGDFRVNNAGMNGEYFHGSLKSVAIFNDIRTAEEIVADTKYSIGGDVNAVVSVDLTNIGDKSEIANFADKDNPVVLKRVKFANTEGMTFNASKLYSFKKALTAFPKTIEVYMKSAIPSANKVIVGNYSGTGTNGTEMTLRVKSGGNLSIFYNGEQYSVTFDTKVDNAYHLYSFVMDGANAHLYVDGTLKETKTIPLKGTDTSANDPNDWNYDTFNGLPWCIGGDNRNGNLGYFTGAIKYA